ncbi:MAG TPA: hypothetical protein VKR79_07690 [Gaiellaceae bacterium]|nr:hypothetical protein [Gaiellaceae bacterium]
MNEFVERCLREWKRVGVPDAVANEMAADLDADLRDAAADDVAPEEVLGNGIFDAPAFARSWAAARGVIPPAHVPVARGDRRSVPAIALAVLAVLSLVLVALVIVHRATRAVAIPRPVFWAPAPGNHPPFVFPPFGAVVAQHVGIGAPLGVFALGLILVALLAGGALFIWRRA